MEGLNGRRDIPHVLSDDGGMKPMQTVIGTTSIREPSSSFLYGRFRTSSALDPNTIVSVYLM